MTQEIGLPLIASASTRGKHINIQIGVLSILFFFGKPIAFDYLDGPFVIDGATRVQQKHLNTWRRYNLQRRLPTPSFNTNLLSALMTEVEALYRPILEIAPMAQRDDAFEDGDESLPKSPLDVELDALDDEDDGEEFDGHMTDDDDFDDEDEDDDDDLDDDGEDLDEDEVDEALDDDEDASKDSNTY